MDRYSFYLYFCLLSLLLSITTGVRIQGRSTLNTLTAELSVVEEQNVDSFSENLNFVIRQALDRAGTQWRDLQPLQATLLEPNAYFRLCPNEALNASFLCLKKRIDREQLCPTEDICCPRFQQPLKSFDSLAPPQGEMRQDDCVISLILMVDLGNIFDGTKQQSLLSLSIRVLDINDHAPTWRLQKVAHPFIRPPNEQGQFDANIPVLSLPIREHTKVGTKIELPEAVDPDAYPENTTVNYGIESDVGGLFSLEWTGKPTGISNFIGSRASPNKLWLVLNKELDRDEAKSHQVKIFAVDGGAVRPQTGYLMLNITVEDVNNHPPRFEKHEGVVWVMEHSPIGSVIYRLRANDQDESDLDKLGFALATSVTSQVASLFAVDRRTGEIRVQGELDYEKVTSYKLSVTVTDGLWFDEAVITVGILNINDHPPVIGLHSHLAAASRFHLFDTHHRVSGSQMTIEVRENGPPDQLVATFTVTDGDDAAEARFLQSNTPIRDAFLQANGLSLQEATERIKLPPRCKLNNDLMEIELLSLDSRSHKARFQLRLAKKSLDREVSAKYLVRIECWDQASRFGNHILAQSNMVGYRNSFSRSTSVIFTLIVLDENDSVPQFVRPLSGSIAEGQPVGTLITQITANDADDPYTPNGQAGLRYSIIGEPDVAYVLQPGSSNRTFMGSTQDVSTWFTLDPRTGELRSAVIFDREVVSFLNLTVSVTDGGEEAKPNFKRNSAFATMKITILDVNDCQPVFDKLVYQLNISEGATPPVLVGKVHANDCDADEINRRLYYWLQQQPINSTSAGRWFTVSRTGELYLGSKSANEGKMHEWRPLDREKEELIVLEVLARDHGQIPLTGSAQVIIRLLDVNDNSPVWHFPRPNERVINVSVDASAGQRIAELNATDGDEGDFGKVTYTIISGNEEGHFELDDQTGCLYISKPFTASPTTSFAPSASDGHEANSTDGAFTANIHLENRLRMLSFKTFRLYLRASDQGSPARTTTAVLDVRLSGPSVPTYNPQPAAALSRSDAPTINTLPTYREQKVLRGRSNQQNPLPGSKVQQYQQQDHDNLISTESLIIIAVMVAAVAALLFIVVLLATACLRKRMLAEHSRRHCVTTPKQKTKNPEFELQFAGDARGVGGGANATAVMVKKIYDVSSQPPPFMDSTSTYVTVTRNTLKRDNNCNREAVAVPNDLTTAYTVQSFDNLDAIQADVLSPYRFEKVEGGQTAGILVQAPSSSLLAMDPRVGQSGAPEESVDVAESLLAQKEIFPTDNAPRKMSTTYTLAEKAPAVGSPVGAVSPQTIPRNRPKAAYVALSPASVTYATEAVQNSGVLLGGKCMAFNKPMTATSSGTGPCSTSPFLIKLAKPAGFLLEADGSRTYTPLNFSVAENAQQRQLPADDSGSTNQESSFV